MKKFSQFVKDVHKKPKSKKIPDIGEYNERVHDGDIGQDAFDVMSSMNRINN